MRRFFFSGMTLFLLLSAATGCKKEVDPPATPLAYSFQLLNEQGQEAKVFAEGQSIVFHFQITNASNQEMYLNSPLFDSTHFLEVYKSTGAQLQSMGKPYQNLCLDYRSFYILPAHASLVFAIPWVKSAQYPDKEPFCNHAATNPLAKGHYRTSFAPLLTWHLGMEPDVTTVPDPQSTVHEFDVQ